MVISIACGLAFLAYVYYAFYGVIRDFKFLKKFKIFGKANAKISEIFSANT